MAANKHVTVSRLHFFVKRKAKIKTKSGWIIFCSTSLLCRILPTNPVASKPAFYTFYTSHLRYAQYYEALFFFFFTRPRTDLFCSFLLNLVQDKLHSFSTEGDRSTHFLWTTNCRIDYIIKHFHEENAIMSGLFSQNNLLLCGLQGSNFIKR